MIDKVKVMLRDGSLISLPDWQDIYGLEKFSNSIGKHFSISEDRFETDLRIYGKLIVNELLMRVLDGYREAKAESVVINSFNRDPAHQEKLRLGGFRAATFSPHVVKLAADADTPGIDDLKKRDKKSTDLILWKEAVRINYDQAALMRQVASIMEIKVRIGHKDYLVKKQTFLHVDVCPEYYAPGKPFARTPHPKVWEKEMTW